MDLESEVRRCDLHEVDDLHYRIPNTKVWMCVERAYQCLSELLRKDELLRHLLDATANDYLDHTKVDETKAFLEKLEYDCGHSWLDSDRYP